MARFFCEGCQKESNFLPIYVAMKIAGVSRRTIYYWLEHRIAQRTARHLRDIPKPTQKTIPRSRPGAEPPTKSAQNCATPRNPVN